MEYRNGVICPDSRLSSEIPKQSPRRGLFLTNTPLEFSPSRYCETVVVMACSLQVHVTWGITDYSRMISYLGMPTFGPSIRQFNLPSSRLTGIYERIYPVPIA